MNQAYAALKNLMESTSTYATMDDHEVKNDYDAADGQPGPLRGRPPGVPRVMPGP